MFKDYELVFIWCIKRSIKVRCCFTIRNDIIDIFTQAIGYILKLKSFNFKNFQYGLIANKILTAPIKFRHRFTLLSGLYELFKSRKTSFPTRSTSGLELCLFGVPFVPFIPFNLGVLTFCSVVIILLPIN